MLTLTLRLPRLLLRLPTSSKERLGADGTEGDFAARLMTAGDDLLNGRPLLFVSVYRPSSSRLIFIIKICHGKQELLIYW